MTDNGVEPTVPDDERTAPGDENEALSFRDRRFGPAFDKRETVIPVGGHRPYDPGEWDDAIVVVEEGAIDITSVDGSHHRFARGDVICLSRMLLAALHNDGDVPALLIAVSRRRPDPTRVAGSAAPPPRKEPQMSTSTPQTASTVAAVRTAVSGRVTAPGDAGYDEARKVFFGGIDRSPAVIVRVGDAADVAAVVTIARRSGLELAVRSGGHSPVGHSVTDGGIVLDLSEMKDLDIDVDGRTAWAETGLTAAEYTAAVGAHGLATGFGDTGSVGIGGITLSGGVGLLVRSHGLTVDSVLGAEIVTADGELVRTDAESHPDLFWALRGGGGNFGVVTRFRYRLHPVDHVVGGMMILPATPEVIAGFVAAAEAAPEELSTIANVMPAPPMPFVPSEHHGRPVVFAMMVYAGDAEAGERAIAPLRGLAAPIVDTVAPLRYPDMFPPGDAEMHPVAAASRSMVLDTVDAATAATILDHLETSTASMAAVQLRVLGGVMARVPVEATAFARRSARVMVNVAAMYEDPNQAAVHEQWVQTLAAELHQGDGAFVGFLAEDGRERLDEAYPGTTLARLAEVKRRYDPTNLFRLNHNIAPATVPGD